MSPVFAGRVAQQSRRIGIKMVQVIALVVALSLLVALVWGRQSALHFFYGAVVHWLVQLLYSLWYFAYFGASEITKMARVVRWGLPLRLLALAVLFYVTHTWFENLDWRFVLGGFVSFYLLTVLWVGATFYAK